MQSFHIEEHDFTPRVFFDTTQNEFSLSGESYVEHAYEFYKPVLSWLENYLAINQKPITFHFQLTYFNTPSSAIICQILQLLNKVHTEQGVPVQVYWNVPENNEAIQEEGELLKEDFVRLPFELVKARAVA
ncbi:MAG TPA: hypothetical protein DCS93_40830 [Microscillaceae bacterium]|nr:hypothetical protein [Microscillaceae bacterium]